MFFLGLKMTLNRLPILLIFFAITWNHALAEKIILNGSVVDSLSDVGIADVSIILEGTEFGTASDRNGHFSLVINSHQPSSYLLIQHISYFSRRIAIRDWRPNMVIRLKIKPIDLPEVEIEASRKPYKYEQDLTNIVSAIPAQHFEDKGFVDAADLLINDQSITVDETVSGRKTISVRGTNNDEVTVLFDGIRINNNYNNQFDLAMIDPNTLQQIDIIKGGNAATIGAYGSSAVINLIPKLEQDYLLKFQQRFGSYDSGDWGLNFYKKIAGVKIFSSIRQGASNQKYADLPEKLAITHATKTYLMNLQCPIGQSSNGDFKHLIKIRFWNSQRDYNNRRYLENLAIDNLTGNLNYSFYLFPAGHTNLGLTFQQSTESNAIRSYLTLNRTKRTTADQSYEFMADQTIRYDSFCLFLGYKLNLAKLNYHESHFSSDGILSWDLPADFLRRQHLISASFQFRNPNSRPSFGWDAVNFNLTLEKADDDLEPVSFYWLDTVSINKTWSEAEYQAALTFTDQSEKPHLSISLSSGIAYNIPTPYQQIAYLRYKPFNDEQIILQPESKRSLEADLTYSGNFLNDKYTYSVSMALFRNLYLDKFREVRISNSPIIVCDNFSESYIYGAEFNGKIDIFKQVVSLQSSFSRYFPSDKIAFPFKSDQKITAGLNINYRGFDLNLFGFAESARTGWIKQRTGATNLAELPAYANIDLHLRKTLKFHRFGGSISISGRNLINRELALEGITIYDQRFYINLGIQI